VRDIVGGLPARKYPWHANNDIVVGPEGHLYFAVGSTSDASEETEPYAASVLRVNPFNGGIEIFATGVRNPYDLAFNAAGDLFGTDNGSDSLEVTPGDELNHIIEGANYGFPAYPNFPPPGSEAKGPVVLFPPHSSADGLTFYESNQFPETYKGNAFIALFNRGEVIRVQLEKNSDGSYMGFSEVFVSGLLNPLDLDVGPDGSLYLIDFTTSALYRISYHR
jgi:glucose/arabinose dehydrogenase